MHIDYLIEIEDSEGNSVIYEYEIPFTFDVEIEIDVYGIFCESEEGLKYIHQKKVWNSIYDELVDRCYDQLQGFC